MKINLHPNYQTLCWASNTALFVGDLSLEYVEAVGDNPLDNVLANVPEFLIAPLLARFYFSCSEASSRIVFLCL